MKKAIEFLNENISANSAVVIACSGGPDSMCLLSLACELRKEKNITIICAHVNHHLRDESSDELAFVKKYCEENNILFAYLDLVQFEREKFSEQKGHKLRYEFFTRVAKDNNAKYICTAHHGDDLIETILMRITRGSTLSGYSGFSELITKDDITFLRPLIYVTKKDIETYNEEHNIPYVIDKSNYSPDYTRNRYRQKVLPFLKEETPNIHLKYLKFNQELNDAYDFIQNYVDKLNVINNNSINITKLENETLYIKRQVIERVIKNIQKYDWLEVNDKQIDQVISLFKGNNRSIDLNNNYMAIKSYSTLSIEKKQSSEEYEYILNNKITHDDWQISIIDETEDDSNNVIRLSSEEIKLPLIIRNRLDGDKMEVKNMNGTKKVKDILIDEKISRSKRNQIPIVLDSNRHIIWLPGIKKSKFAKNKTQKYDIIVKYETRRN